VDETSFVVLFKLLAEIADVDLDNIAFTAKIIALYSVEDKIARQYLAWVAQEEL
jgi:hypothetical protein